MSLITPTELRSYLRAGEEGGDVIVGSREADEDFLQLLCDAASRRAERYTGRRFTPEPVLDADPLAPLPAPVTETVHAGGRELVAVPDVREATLIVADTVELALDTVVLFARPEEPATLLKLPATAQTVTITGYFGFVEPPEDVRLAVLSMAARSFHDAQARLGDRIVDPDGGVTSYFRQLPVEAKGTLDAYRAARPIPLC